jgi:hypothetical protein
MEGTEHGVVLAIPPVQSGQRTFTLTPLRISDGSGDNVTGPQGDMRLLGHIYQVVEQGAAGNLVRGPDAPFLVRMLLSSNDLNAGNGGRLALGVLDEASGTWSLVPADLGSDNALTAVLNAPL